MATATADRTAWLATELARPGALPADAGPVEVRRTLVSLLEPGDLSRLIQLGAGA